MPTEAKRETVAELTQEFQGSRASIVADYRGLTMSELTTVRRALRDKGIQYRVVKNRLAKIAATDAGIEELVPLLEGPTAIALGGEDETVLARSFLDATRPYRTIVVRGGVIGGRRIEADGVTRLATLPGRDVLLGQLAGGFASPLSTMAGLLAAPLRDLASCLQQLAEQRGGDGAAASQTTT
jgi:large subunit ribosomal protein L10